MSLREEIAEKRISSSQSLIRSLLALPELRMRILWIEERIFTRPVHELAPLLNDVAERSQSTDPRAREVMVALSIYLAQQRDSALTWALHEQARSRALLGLERLLRERRDKHAADVELEPRVPDYGTGRELTVGERKALARRPTRLQIDRLLLDPHPLVLDQLFRCPALTEGDVLRIVTRRPARLVAIELLVKSSRWMQRPRVRLALILNPGTPHSLALPLLATCPRDELKLVIETTNLSKTLRAVAHELFSRMPPVHEAFQQRHQH